AEFAARALGGEVSAHQVRHLPFVGVADGGGPVRPRLARDQVQLPHQPADQLGANLLADTDKLGVDTPVAVGLVVVVEQRSDLDLQVFSPLRGGAGRTVQPLVIAGSGHRQPGAHAPDGGSITDMSVEPSSVLRIDELILLAHRCSRAKYAAAFFRKMFSISRSRLRRSSSRNLARSETSKGGSSVACFSRYALTQLPNDVSVTSSSRATAAIGDRKSVV